MHISVLVLVMREIESLEQNNKLLIGCVIMAAGKSSRFGAENKLMIPFMGKVLIAHPMDQILKIKQVFTDCEKEICLDPVVVTCWREVEALCEKKEISCITYAGGPQSETIRQGLCYGCRRGWNGAMFMAADQPFTKAESIENILDLFAKDPEQICALGFGQTVKNPVIFPASCFENLCSLSGEQGGKALLMREKLPVTVVEVTDPAELADLDTRDDYLKMQGEE